MSEEADAIGVASDIVVRLIQGDHGSGQCWRIAQTLGAVVEYVRDLLEEDTEAGNAVAGDVIQVIMDNMIYLVPPTSPEDIDLEVQRNKQILEQILGEDAEENGDK